MMGPARCAWPCSPSLYFSPLLYYFSCLRLHFLTNYECHPTV